MEIVFDVQYFVPYFTVEIIDNPKYKMAAGMGVCQLEIRRPRLGDAGIYTCVATNPSGEASCESTVTVKEPK